MSNTYICPKCENEQHIEGAKYCAVCGRRVDIEMKEVLISIHPEYPPLIFSREKTVELRKNMLNCSIPFKVYLYETKAGAGAVVGEFVCNGTMCARGYSPLFDGSCVSESEINRYADGGMVYGWHIMDPVQYDMPKPLSDFGLERAPQSWCYIRRGRY